MANLRDIAKSKGIEIKDRPQPPIRSGVIKPEPNISQSKAKVEPEQFKKRRAWLETEQTAAPQEVSERFIKKIETPLKLSQSEVKLEPQPEPRHKPKLSQSEAKVEPVNKNMSQQKIKLEPQPEPRHKPKLSQSEAKVEPVNSYTSLVGLQKNALSYVFNSCRQRGSKMSGPITISNLEIALKSPKSAVRKAIQRLEQKQCLKRISFKDGRGGWSEYLVPDEIYSAFLYDETRAKVEPIISQTRAKVGTQLEPQPEPSSPVVVVSSNINNTTTTETRVPEEPCFIIPSELSGKVSRRQLSEFVLTGKISEYELQLSLDAFAYDLKNRNIVARNTSNPVAILIGAIKNNGSYNSAKYAELLKNELKPIIQAQQSLKDSISDHRAGEGWAKYQELKKTDPEAFEKLIEKYKNQGLKNETLLDDFGFMEFQAIAENQTLITTDPLRPGRATE